jgi:hypothetical protein
MATIPVAETLLQVRKTPYAINRIHAVGLRRLRIAERRSAKAKTRSLEQAATQDVERPKLVGANGKRSSGMGQANSFDAENANITPAAGVPMLDWPSDLFSDEASLKELVTVDFLMPCAPAFLPHEQQPEELDIQLAA